MKDIHLHNTLGNKKEVFIPQKNNDVSMYTCGPTVYNFAHIGNLRAYIFADVLRRTIESTGSRVTQIVNITDVGHLTSDNDTGDDKVEKMAKSQGKSASDITNFYTDAFLKDIQELNIEVAAEYPEHFPKATDYIQEQINFIKELEEKEFTYKTSDGIYFDTSKFRGYGKLGNIDIEKLKEGARVEKNNEKKNPTDFALWKFSQPSEQRLQEWESPWGKGFPGWHIECSVMSMEKLGNTIDIHTGGIDHIAIHHNNEIAQSESLTGKDFVKYWLHTDFVNVESGKMAKSGNNFITLKTLKENGIHPLAYRYWLLTAHYRSPVSFSYEAVKGAQEAFNALLVHVWQHYKAETGTVIEEWIEDTKKFAYDDLDTPKIIAYIHSKLNTDKSENEARSILEIDNILGLGIKQLVKEYGNIPDTVRARAQKREQFRQEKKWTESDAIRDELKKEGYILMDGESGSDVLIYRPLSTLILTQ